MNDTLKDLKGAPGAEPQEVAELRLTECKLRWKEGACQADGLEPCYNVIQSCQDTENFSLAGRAVLVDAVDDGSGNFSASVNGALNETVSGVGDDGDPVTLEFFFLSSDVVQTYALHDNAGTSMLEVDASNTAVVVRVAGTQEFSQAFTANEVHHVAVIMGRGAYANLTVLVDGQVEYEAALSSQTTGGVDATHLSLDTEVKTSGYTEQFQLLRVWKRALLPNRVARDRGRHLPTSTRYLVGQWSGTKVEGGELYADRGSGGKLTGTTLYTQVEESGTITSLIDEDPLRLRFCSYDRPVPAGLNATPTLLNSSVAEVKIEVGELGSRGQSSITLADHVDDDRDLDPYRDDPARVTQFEGTFNARLRARHGYYHQRESVVYTGYEPVRRARLARFAGAEYVTLPSRFFFDVSNYSYTFDFHLRVNTLPSSGHARVFSKDGFDVRVLSTGELQAVIDGNTLTTTSGYVKAGRWVGRVQIEITSTGHALRVVSEDGGVSLLDSASVSQSNFGNTGGQAVIAKDHSIDDRYLVGDLADFRAWRKEFSLSESRFFNFFRPEDQSILLAYYPLYDDTWADWSGNGIDGTVTGTVNYYDDRREWTHPPVETEELLEGLTAHLYLIERMSGPGSDQKIEVLSKDPITFLEEEKAQYPQLSRGVLAADLSESAGNGSTFDVSLPTGVDVDDEYQTGVHKIRVGDEHIEVDRNSGSVTFTIQTRAVDHTELSSHDKDDTVQNVVVPKGTFDELVVDFFSRAGAPDKFVPASELANEIENNTPDLIFQRILSEPTSIKKLLNQLIVAAGVDFWWDDRLAKFRVRAQKSPPDNTPVVDFNSQVYARSITREDNQEDILTQVWVFFGQLNPTEDVDKLSNYAASILVPRLSAETQPKLGKSRIKKIATPWIIATNKPAAEDVGDRLLRRLGGLPFKVEAELDYFDIGQFWTGDIFRMKYENYTKLSGEPLLQPMQIVGAKEIDPGVRYRVQLVNYDYETTVDDQTNVVEFSVNKQNVNLRQEHDNIYSSVNDKTLFRVLSGVIIGSSDPANVAMELGDWSDVTTDITIEIIGRVQGAAGPSGDGGSITGTSSDADGQNGQNGGDAIKVSSAVTIDNQGEIWAGSGGSGGGGAAHIKWTDPFTNDQFEESNGAGGAGGATGYDPSLGGAKGTATSITSAPTTYIEDGTAGQDGTTDSGGSKGTGGDARDDSDGPDCYAGDGGAGVGPGLDGNPGQDGFASTNASVDQRVQGSGGTAGTAGNYIDGDTYVTWENTGDRRGNST